MLYTCNKVLHILSWATVSARLQIFLLLLLGHLHTLSLAVAPGDESDDCEVSDYPDNIRVLLDSWRYQTLLSPKNDDTTTTNTVWTTHSDRDKNNIVSL